MTLKLCLVCHNPFENQVYWNLPSAFPVILGKVTSHNPFENQVYWNNEELATEGQTITTRS